MSKNTITLSNNDLQRIETFLSSFSKESPQIRQEIANTLPSYNILLNLNAKTFEEFALLSIAKENKLPYESAGFDFRTIKPPCPNCREEDLIKRTGDNAYSCKRCGKTYAANYNSISSGTNCSSITWMKVLYCLFESYSVKKTCDYCNITASTYYNIRSKLFHAMEILLSDVKLYGNIYTDTTFIRVSYKGMDMSDNDYPEDSPFEQNIYKPERDARSRGDKNKNEERNTNGTCIFTAIDEFGHVLVKFVGIGAASTRLLEMTVGKNSYLKNVPVQDPFNYMKKRDLKELSKPGYESLLVSDGERAIIKYADNIGLPCEYHVYRSNGVQRSLPKDAKNIQKVNALHKRLKDFLRNANYVSTKYLPGFLVLFSYIENTGKSEESIGELFRILTQPGLQESASFYKEKYTVPDYLTQNIRSGSPLKGIPDNKLLAFYLYSKKMEAAENDKDFMTLKEISVRTGYSVSTIRRDYKKFKENNLTEYIYEYIEEKSRGSVFREIKQQKIIARRKSKINDTILQIYDEYIENLKLPPNQRLRLDNFLKKVNVKYGVSLTESRFIYLSDSIRKLGLRAPRREKKKTLIDKGQEYLPFYEKYKELRKSYELRGEKIPIRDELLKILSEECGYSPKTLAKMIAIASQYLIFIEETERNE